MPLSRHDPAGGTGNVLNSSLGPNPNQCTVNLTNVSNGQYITVNLNGVADTAGRNGNVNGPKMGVFVGDTNGNGAVNAWDVGQTKGQSGQAVAATNFRQDANANGSINAGDVSLVNQEAARVSSDQQKPLPDSLARHGPSSLHSREAILHKNNQYCARLAPEII